MRTIAEKLRHVADVIDREAVNDDSITAVDVSNLFGFSMPEVQVTEETFVRHFFRNHTRRVGRRVDTLRFETDGVAFLCIVEKEPETQRSLSDVFDGDVGDRCGDDVAISAFAAPASASPFVSHRRIRGRNVRPRERLAPLTLYGGAL